MYKEKIVKFGIYGILGICILLFLMGIVLPQKFDKLILQGSDFLTSFFQIQGWIVVLSCFMSFLGCIYLFQFIISFYPKNKPFYAYTHDLFRQTQWKWKWKNDHIDDLWCYCPTCNQELSYSCDHLLFQTKFLCAKCEKQIATYDGDNINYVLTRVKAEIQRVIKRKLQENKIL